MAYIFWINEIDFDWRRRGLVRELTETELTVASQAERVQPTARRRVRQHVAPTARDLRDLAAHEVLHLARQVLVARAVVA